MNNEPMRNGKNGRDGNGRFTRGNPGGPGNPYMQRVAAIRAALMEAVAAEDLRGIVRALIAKAKKGDVAAAHEVFDRIFGKAKQTVEQEGGGLKLVIHAGPGSEQAGNALGDKPLPIGLPAAPHGEVAEP